MKNILFQLKIKIIERFLNLKKKRKDKILIKKVIKNYRLDDIDEQKKIIEKYYRIQHNKRALGRKARLHVEEKIKFMSLNGLIKLK